MFVFISDDAVPDGTAVVVNCDQITATAETTRHEAAVVVAHAMINKTWFVSQFAILSNIHLLSALR
jgi:hypothetical protein